MFEIGFWELVLLFGLGLIVLGPDKLPKVADQLGRYAGQARRMARTFTNQIRDEIEAEERRASNSSTPTAPAADPSVPAFSRPGVDELIPNAAEPVASTEAEESPDAGSLDQVRGSGL
jgi:Tat protein translocase TatB subunit